MALTLYFHPFASFCQKVLVALYENDTPFTTQMVDLTDEATNASYKKIWPVGKMPILRDDATGRVVPESSIIIEYLAQHWPGKVELLPADADLALEVRMRDRFYDLYVQEPMQKIVGDRLRPKEQRDAHGVDAARAQLKVAYGMIEEQMKTKTWAAGDTFTMADCAAAPSLFYANLVVPFGDAFPHAGVYLDRLMKRPSFARVVEEAQPYFKLFPQG
ncbi:MAG TPA: glutathione S-transferase family protein [Polyangiaceae bacterium]|nr:glutathione S-transferase family protein [Polyangiaceae bacterium]